MYGFCCRTPITNLAKVKNDYQQHFQLFIIIYYLCTAHPEFTQSASIPLERSTHNGQDVPVYAAGPMSHLFHQTHDNTFVAHVIRFATCMGQYKGMCSRSARGQKGRKMP